MSKRKPIPPRSWWPHNGHHSQAELSARFVMHGPTLMDRQSGKPAGQPLTGPQRNLGRVVNLDGHLYLARDLAWVLQTGRWPRSPLLHRGATGDNRRENLQEGGYAPQPGDSNTKALARHKIQGIHNMTRVSLKEAAD